MHIKIRNWFQNHLNLTKQMYKQAWFSYKKNKNKPVLCCWIQQPNSMEEVVAGPCSQDQPATWAPNKYTAPIQISTLPATQKPQHSHEHQWPHPVPLSGWSRWSSVSEKYIYVYIQWIPLVAGSRHSPPSNWPLILLAPGHASSPRYTEPHASGWYRPSPPT